MALKVDIRKAFDYMDWGFIHSILLSFGFSSHFCDWISAILKSANLSILLNGSPKGYFSCSRGVRQGDPLSPLLFCLAEEYLNRRLASLFDSKAIVSMYGGNHVPCPTHLLYADDVLIFYRATKSNVTLLSKVFSQYGALSGQWVNWDKSDLFVGNFISSIHVTNIHSCIGVRSRMMPFIYLGVPIFYGAPKVCWLKPIADHILSKFEA